MAFDANGEVAIVGVGRSKIGRKQERSIGALAVESCLRAVEDAGLTMPDIDGTLEHGGGAADSGPRGIEWADVDAKYRPLVPASGLPARAVGESLEVIHGFEADATRITALLRERAPARSVDTRFGPSV